MIKTINDIPWDSLKSERRRISGIEAFLDLVFSHHKLAIGAISLLKNKSDISECYFFRTYDELQELFLEIKLHFHLDERHSMNIYVENLAVFLQYSISFIDFDSDLIAKSKSEVLQCSCLGHSIQFYSAHALLECSVNDFALTHGGVIIDELNTDRLSYLCYPNDLELSYFTDRKDVVLSFYKTHGNKLTRTAEIAAKIESYKGAEFGKGKNDSAAWLWNQDSVRNPRMNWLLPLLLSAFIGGHSFVTERCRSIPISDVYSADFSAAYSYHMLFSKFPMSKFLPLPIPENYHDITTKPIYTSKALLISFTVEECSCKKISDSFIPLSPRYTYTEGEVSIRAKSCYTHRIDSCKSQSFVLTDIDFKLFLKIYDFKKITIEKILGARYGFLPNYVCKPLIEDLNDKNYAKKLKKNNDPMMSEWLYEIIKSRPSRYYGIFTMSPVVQSFIIDRKKIRHLSAKDGGNSKIYKGMARKGVLYQWGVWVTAHARYSLFSLKEKLEKNHCRIISGDTDCLNFTGDATSIIALINNDVKNRKAEISKLRGWDLQQIGDVGEIDITHYKKYVVTAVKQYAYIDGNGKFNYRAAGMDRECSFFEENYNSEEEKFNAWRCGLIIPAEYSPRSMILFTNKPFAISYIDREGNRIEDIITSYCEERSYSYSLHADPIAAVGLNGNKSNEDEHFKLMKRAGLIGDYL